MSRGHGPNFVDLTDRIYGRLKVLCYSHSRNGAGCYWICRCDCGKNTTTTSSQLNSGKTKSCGCIRREFGQNRLIDLTNRRYGKLLVLGRAEDRPDASKRYYWICKCDCGATTEISGGNLRNGDSKSCGCANHKSGHHHPSWKGYKQLSGSMWGQILHNAKIRNIPIEITIEYAADLFDDQGGRCRLSGESISLDGGEGRVTASLDRINSDLGYIPGNCQWIHKDVNQMKWDMPQPKFVEWCDKVSKYQSQNYLKIAA
jgi:hypothetical protein